MAHKVICLYCKKQFDRDKEPTQKVSARRYAHLNCWKEHLANMSQEEKDIQNFFDYTKKLFGEDYNYILTKKLAERYLNKIGVPNVIVKRGDLDLEQMGHLLEENKVKIMTIHSAKGLEFPYVVVVGAKTFSQEERRICYVAATRSMDSLYWCPTIKTHRGKSSSNNTKAGNVFSKSSKKVITF